MTKPLQKMTEPHEKTAKPHEEMTEPHMKTGKTHQEMTEPPDWSPPLTLRKKTVFWRELVQ